MKHCPGCSLDFPAASRFCKYCGGDLIDVESASLPPATPKCSSCGTQIEAGQETCADCIQKVSESSSADPITAPSRVCHSCGTDDNPADAMFCKECGVNLDAIQEAEPMPIEQVAPQQASPPFVQYALQPDAAPSGQTQSCSNCGAWNRAGLIFCEACGKPLAPSVAQARAATKSRKPLVAAIGSGALLLLLCLGWILWGVNVSVVSNSPGARVFIDGAEVGQTSLSDGQASIAHLGRGQHSLRVERSGFATFNQTFDLGWLSFSKTIEARLDPSAFALTVVTDPPGCRVSLDSTEKGTTDSDRGEIVLADISRGHHSLTLSSDGYRDWSQEITLDSPQMIRANLTPLPSETFSSADNSGGAASAQSEVESTLQGWARSLNNRDVEGNLSYYAEHLDTFLTRSDVGRDQVRAARLKMFATYSSVDLELNNMQINFDPSGARAFVTLDTKYNFRGKGSLTGSAQDELWLEKRGNRWLIINERHLQTYYETRGD